MTKRLITLSCCCLISISLARSRPTRSLSFSCLDYTFHIVSARRAATLRLEEDDD